jgi:formate dehydrogenase major subunit/formate dehydrogenase-N alpha subunit
MLQLLLGNIGMAGGGLTRCAALQYSGLYRPGATLHQSAGVYAVTIGKTAGLSNLYCANHPCGLCVNYWQNTPKFFVSMMKSFWGDSATAENNWGYDWLPKWDAIRCDDSGRADDAGKNQWLYCPGL